MNFFRMFALVNLVANAVSATLSTAGKPTNITDTLDINPSKPEPTPMFSATRSRNLKVADDACKFAKSQFEEDFGVKMSCSIVTFNPNSISETGQPVEVAGKIFTLKNTTNAKQKYKAPKLKNSNSNFAAVPSEAQHEYIPLTLTPLNSNEQPTSLTVEDGTQVYGCVWGTKKEDGKEHLTQTVVIIQPCNVGQSDDPTCHTMVSLDSTELTKKIDEKYAGGLNDAVPFEHATDTEQQNTKPDSKQGRQLDAPGRIELYVRIGYSGLAADEIGRSNLNGNALNQLHILNNILHYQGFNNVEFKLKDVIVVEANNVGKTSSQLLAFARYPSNIPRDGADELVFIVSGREMTNACGIGFIDCGAPGLNNVEIMEQCMTAVVNLNCFYRFTFQHEVGHNFGLNHERKNAQNPSQRLPDAFGYYFVRGSEDIQGTVMSYNGERVPVFSQNAATYNGVPIGSADANNIRVFAQVAWEIYTKYLALRGQAAPPTTASPTNPVPTKTPSVATQSPTDTQTIAPSSENTNSPTSRNSTSATDPNNTSAAIAAPIAASAIIAAAAAVRNRKKIREKAAALKRKLHKVKKRETTAFKSGHTDALVTHTGEQSTTTAPVTFTPSRNTRQPPPPPQRSAQPMVNANPIAAQEFAKITASTPRTDIEKKSHVAEMRQKFENRQAPKAQVPPKKPVPPIPKRPDAGATRSKRSPSL